MTPVNVGDYIYTPPDASGRARFNAMFANGDYYDLRLNFADEKRGTWGGLQHFDNMDFQVPAGSTFFILP
jgi:hypothetical protein